MKNVIDKKYSHRLGDNYLNVQLGGCLWKI